MLLSILAMVSALQASQILGTQCIVKARRDDITDNGFYQLKSLREGFYMRRILNFLITVLILFLASHFFPAHVHADSFGWLLLAAVLIWVVSTCIALMFFLMLAAGAALESVAWMILPLIGIFFSEIIAILLLSKWLSGFWVSGFWVAALLSICITILSIGKKSEDSST